MSLAPSAPPTPPTRTGWRHSLRWRLLLATVLALALALLLAGWVLGGLFRDHVMRQFQADLGLQLEQVTARLDFDASGQPVLDGRNLSDPRWLKPLSGLYWQVDGPEQRGVLRSRSLWDAVLTLPVDVVADGALHLHGVLGPQGRPVWVMERSVRPANAATGPWTLMVAADLQSTHDAVDGWNNVLAASLAVLLVLMALAAVAQVAVGLAPLRGLQRALQRLDTGQAQRLQGDFPAEVQPLIDDFNRVLDQHETLVTRARTQAGNLAHAVKTPLAVMANAAQSAQSAPNTQGALAAQPTSAGRADPLAAAPAQALVELAKLVTEQVDAARQQVDWHLARARATAASGLPGLRVPLAPQVEALVRVMAKVHAHRDLQVQVLPGQPELWFLGEAPDLSEMLGNLLDNACKWAHSQVQVGWVLQGTHWVLTVDDDGPGLPADQRERVLQRGVRADEQVPGSGLGLAIVHDLALLYGGDLALAPSVLGGLRAALRLPGAALAGAAP